VAKQTYKDWSPAVDQIGERRACLEFDHHRQRRWDPITAGRSMGAGLATGGECCSLADQRQACPRLDVRWKILWEFPTISGVAAVSGVRVQVDGKQYMRLCNTGLGRDPAKMRARWNLLFPANTRGAGRAARFYVFGGGSGRT